tara:strand:- start:5320 stop:6969 length:1650 start_codon:yes stop_codon:yes gene_type:complete
MILKNSIINKKWTPNIYLVLVLFFFLKINIFYTQTTNKKTATYIEKALKLKTSKPDSSIILFQKSIDLYLKEKDTLNAIKTILEKAFVYETNAKYAKSYDILWKALIYMDKIDNDGLKSVVYHRIGRIYSYYKREDKSIEYLNKALQTQKKLHKRAPNSNYNLAPYYYSIAATYRELVKPKIGQIYLDSCYFYFKKEKSKISKSLLDFEKANLLNYNNKSKEALVVMDEIYPWFKKNTPSYLVLFYKYWGDIHLKLGELKKSEDYYLKSLQVSFKYNSHKDFTPLIYEKLAELYVTKKEYQKAYQNLEIAKSLDAKFFDSRSIENQSLLEIKDDYRLEKERQEKIIQEQYLKQLEQEEQIIKLQNIILIGSIIFILLFGFLYFKNLRTKHKTEKELISRTKQLEIEKTKELLELKNRELAASALQLIEKDEFLKELKTKVRTGGDGLKVQEINKVLRSVSVNNNKNWEEFKMRFIEVNKEFYDQIFAKFPNLSQGDQKICALIKLNFSSKEMSRLLGISVESVHTLRHRIRKKMKLSRSINLEDFINSI